MSKLILRKRPSDGQIVSIYPLTEIDTELTESEPPEAKLLETRRKISAAVTSRDPTIA